MIRKKNLQQMLIIKSRPVHSASMSLIHAKDRQLGSLSIGTIPAIANALPNLVLSVKGAWNNTMR